jgi:hypothetical protein
VPQLLLVEMSAPTELNCAQPAPCELTANVVEVAFARMVFPASVEDAAKNPPRALSNPEIVVEPVTASEVDVAPAVVTPWSVVPPKTARPALRFAWPPTFNIEETVDEPRTAKDVEVAPWREVLPVMVSDWSESVSVRSVPTFRVAMVEDPPIYREVPVALAKYVVPRVEDAE